MKNQTIRMTAIAAAISIASVAAHADTRDQAKRIHERLTGVPPTETTLLEMVAELEPGGDGGEAAADIAMNHPAFYNVTLKNWATPWTNRDFDVFQPLNDYTATVIGLVRDGDTADFRDILTGDVTYVGTSATGVTPYSTSNNSHYEELEEQNINLGDPANFEAVAQSTLNGLPSDATAGVMTSRAAAKSFFILGTNRAMFRFTLINHLCDDLEQLNDVTRDPGRIRQDVSRSPGGDSRAFLNNCLGCHAGMDPLAQAFAYYNYEFDPQADPDAESGQITYNDIGDIDPETGTRVVAKYHINDSTFPYGFVTPDDRWDNYWREGQNDQYIGWDDGLDGFGNGAKSLGEELANTEAFAYCQVEKAFEAVCLREPGDEVDRNEIDGLVSSFQTNYNMKAVFAGAADYCKGE